MPRNKRTPRKLNPHKVLRHFTSQTDLAATLGVTQQAVSKMVREWDRHRRPLPDRHHIKLAHARPAAYGYLLQQ